MKTNFYFLSVRVALIAFCCFITADVYAQTRKERKSRTLEQSKDSWDSKETLVDSLQLDSLGLDSAEQSLIPLPTRLGKGEISLNMDSAITSLYIEAADKETVLNGYRIQIYFGDLESARAVRAKCRKQLNHDRIYLESISPNYSGALGDYRDRWEAELALSSLKRKYRDALIIPAEIKMPDLK